MMRVGRPLTVAHCRRVLLRREVNKVEFSTAGERQAGDDAADDGRRAVQRRPLRCALLRRAEQFAQLFKRADDLRRCAELVNV